jgi:hypothetical protein
MSAFPPFLAAKSLESAFDPLRTLGCCGFPIFRCHGVPMARMNRITPITHMAKLGRGTLGELIIIEKIRKRLGVALLWVFRSPRPQEQR